MHKMHLKNAENPQLCQKSRRTVSAHQLIKSHPQCVSQRKYTFSERILPTSQKRRWYKNTTKLSNRNAKMSKQKSKGKDRIRLFLTSCDQRQTLITQTWIHVTVLNPSRRASNKYAENSYLLPCKAPVKQRDLGLAIITNTPLST